MQNAAAVLTELQQVKKFLAESEDFKKMQEIAATEKPTVFGEGNVPQRPHSQVLVEEINNCNTFSELLNATRLKDNLPPMAVTVPLSFVLGFFDQSANIAYYHLWLRRKLENKVAELGYNSPVQQSSNKGPSSR